MENQLQWVTSRHSRWVVARHHRNRTNARLVIGLVFALAATPPASAGSEWGSIVDELMPSVEVTMTHPPRLPLVIDKVAFVPTDGRCVGDFVSTLIGRFIENNVEVIERDRLEQLLAERDLSISGFVDQADAIEIGKLLGPSALVFVDELRCSTSNSMTHKTVENKNGNRYRIYYAKTEVSFSTSLRIVALETGRLFTAKTFEATRSEVAQGRGSQPSYPSDHGPQRLAIQAAVEQAHRIFFPWVETKELRYFKDKKCDLMFAYRMLKIGDVEGAAGQSAQNLERCKTQPGIKPKTLARAHYNFGMSQFMLDDHQRALEHFENAYRIKPGPRIREAILECQKAEREAVEMSQYESLIAGKLRVARVDTESSQPQPLDAIDSHGGSEGRSSAQRSPASEFRSVAERLKELEGILGDGLISKEEFEAKKLKILEDL